MTRKDGGVLVEVHEKHGLSAADVERVNKLYNCNEISDEDGDIHVVDESPIPHWSHQNPNLWGGQWGSWDNPQLIDLHKT